MKNQNEEIEKLKSDDSSYLYKRYKVSYIFINLILYFYNRLEKKM